MDITSQKQLPICFGHSVGLHFANKNRVVHLSQLRENQTAGYFATVRIRALVLNV